jgi:hypothetical protein
MSADWHQISRVYHETLARNPRDRAAFHDAACAGDPGLRAELESLLEQSATLDRTTIDGPAGAGPARSIGFRSGHRRSLRSAPIRSAIWSRRCTYANSKPAST